MGNLARYIVRACFSQERMIYVPADQSLDNKAKVIYTGKDGQTKQTFEALDWLARLITHVPRPREQMVRHYGFYSNKSRGLRKKSNLDNEPRAIIQSNDGSKSSRQNWAKLIQQI